MEQGFKVLDSIEKENPKYYKLIEELSDIIHKGISQSKEDANV